MGLNMKAPMLFCCSTHPFRIHTIYVSCLEYIFIIFNSQLILALDIFIQYCRTTFELNFKLQRGIFLFHFSIKLGYYYLLTLIKRCTSSSENFL